MVVEVEVDRTLARVGLEVLVEQQEVVEVEAVLAPRQVVLVDSVD